MDADRDLNLRGATDAINIGSVIDEYIASIK